MRRLVTTIAAVTLTAGIAAACGNDSPASAADFGTYKTAAASIEEVSERLAPRSTQSGTGQWDPLCENDVTEFDPYAPEYQDGLLTGDDREEISIRVWILPSAREAAERTGEAMAKLSDCPSTVEFAAGWNGEARVEFADGAPVGWQGGRQITTGLHGIDTDSSLAGIAGHTVVASRGVMLVKVTWQRISDKADDQVPPDSWQEEGSEAVAEVLSVLGGDPGQPAPTEPEPEGS